MENQNKQKNDLPIKLNKGTGMGLIFTVGAFLTVLICVSVLFWQGSVLAPEVQSNFSEIDELADETEKLQNGLNILLDVNTVSLETELARVEKALPNEKSVTGFVSALTNMATSSGTTVNSIQIEYGKVSTDSAGIEKGRRNSVTEGKDVEIGNDVVGVPLDMNVIGDGGQILDLIGKVQQALPLLGILEMNYNLTNTAKNGDLSVLIFSQPGEVFNMSKIVKVSPISQTERQWIDSLSSKTNILQ